MSRQAIVIGIVVAFIVVIALAVYFSHREEAQLENKCAARGLVVYEIEHTSICREPSTGQLYAPQ
jgi:hypothetical protein